MNLGYSRGTINWLRKASEAFGFLFRRPQGVTLSDSEAAELRRAKFKAVK